MRAKNEKHLKFIRSLPCCICGDNTSTESAHVRMSDHRIAKFNPGIGRKPADSWTVPLCNKHHAYQHEIGEDNFWTQVAQHDPILLALALWEATGDHEAGCQIIAACKS